MFWVISSGSRYNGIGREAKIPSLQPFETDKTLVLSVFLFNEKALALLVNNFILKIEEMLCLCYNLV